MRPISFDIGTARAGGTECLDRNGMVEMARVPGLNDPDWRLAMYGSNAFAAAKSIQEMLDPSHVPFVSPQFIPSCLNGATLLAVSEPGLFSAPTGHQQIRLLCGLGTITLSPQSGEEVRAALQQAHQTFGLRMMKLPAAQRSALGISADAAVYRLEEGLEGYALPRPAFPGVHYLGGFKKSAADYWADVRAGRKTHED